MLNRNFFASVVLSFAGSIASAQSIEPAKGDALFQSLGLPAMLEVMREEGIVYGEEIGTDLFGGIASDNWKTNVSRIYDVDRMKAEVSRSLFEELDGSDVDAMIAFFSSEPGQSIIQLELSARRAMLDDEIEEASKEIAAEAAAEKTPRYQQVKRFVDANDLVETNVVGAMNANYAFFMGLADGGGFDGTLSEQDILTDVWSQEPEIRESTAEWVYSFLMLAYQPLSEAELEAYIEFSQTEAGQDLNDAMFLAFDGMFENISRALGLSAAEIMLSQDI